jgi:hypothetical protein
MEKLFGTGQCGQITMQIQQAYMGLYPATGGPRTLAASS